MVKNDIKLQTTKSNIRTIIESTPNLSNSIIIKYLTEDLKPFFYSNIKLKNITKGTIMDSSTNAGNLHLVIRGEILSVFRYKNSQKLISEINPGDFFATRKDFDTLFYYLKEDTLMGVLNKNKLMELFLKAPQIKELLKNHLLRNGKILQELKNLS